MKKTNNILAALLRMYRGGLIAGLAGLALALSAIGGQAQVYTLSVVDSSIQVNLSSGLSDWIVGGADQLGGQSFYYATAGTSYPISDISAPSAPVFGGSGFGSDVFTTNMSVTYASSTLSVKTGYSLSVFGTGAELNTTLTLQNNSGASQTLQIYQLSNFTLDGASGGQTVQFLPSTDYAVTQTGPGGAVLNGSLSGLALGTSVQVEEIAGTGNFGIGNGTTPQSFSGGSLSATGSVDYAYEFDVTLPANAGVTISELQTVPEPSSVALISCGMVGLGLMRRRGLALLKK